MRRCSIPCHSPSFRRRDRRARGPREERDEPMMDGAPQHEPCVRDSLGELLDSLRRERDSLRRERKDHGVLEGIGRVGT